MDAITAALYFRFDRPTAELPDDVRWFIEANARDVAMVMPHGQGLELLDYAGVHPEFYEGLPEPRGAEAWKDRARYLKIRVERGEVPGPLLRAHSAG